MRALLLSFAFLAVGPMGTAAIAQELGTQKPGAQKPLGESLRTSCANDIQKLCTGIRPGGGRIVACLHDHIIDLSENCSETIADLGHRTPMAAMWFACGADVQKLCDKVKAGRGRIARCLKDHSAELSSDCVKAATAANQKWADPPSSK